MPTETSATGAPLVAKVVAKFTQVLLADRGSLRNCAAVVNFGDYGVGLPNQGSMTATYSLFGFDGYNLLTTTAEGSAVSETAITMAAKDITVAARYLRRSVSDELRKVDPSGQLNIPRLVMDGYMSAMITLSGLLAGLMSGFSAVEGTSGVAFSHDLFLAAKGALEAGSVPGPYACFLHPTHFKDWSDDLEARGGLTQWRPAAVEMQILRGPGFKGFYDGVEVYTSDKVPASGSDYVSGMFGRGAIGFVEMAHPPFPASAHIVLQQGPIAIEEERDAVNRVTDVVTHYNVGVAEIDDACGVGMLAA